MAFASGAFKKLAINEEVTFGTLVAAGGIYLDRIESTVDLTKDAYRSAAIRTDQQKTISRHGMQKVGGPIRGELNPGAYSRFMQALLRRDFATGATTGAQTTISADNTTHTFNRSAGSFLTNGFKVGRVVQASGFVASGNNTRRFLVTSVTATVMGLLNLDGSTATLTTEAAGATVTITEVGKTTYVPSSGHTDKSFSIESFYSDINQSEALVGCKPTSMDITVPTTGLDTVEFSVLGQKLLRNTSAQLTTPSAAIGGNGLASANGVILIQGASIGIINSLSMKIDGQHAVDGVVGSNFTPFVWPGPIVGTGNFTAFFQDAVMRDYFADETEVAITLLLTASNVAAPEFLAFTASRVKVNGFTKDDKETGGIKGSGTLEFLRNTAGGSGTSSDDSTFTVQDSLAP